MAFNTKYNNVHQYRFSKTLNLLDKYVDREVDHILDLGEENPFSIRMRENGYSVENTPKGMDLDQNAEWFREKEAGVVTSFEIFEHLTNPFQVLSELKSSRLIATVPLRFWFAKAYRNKADTWDQHYHEFEDWQFDMLLKKTGWKIIYREKWKIHNHKIGFRPLLRRFYPRIYVVVAERIR